MARAMNLAVAAAALAAGSAALAGGADTTPAVQLQWRDIVPGVVAFAPVYGDWEKGAHGKFARIAAGAKVPMHTHSNAYHAVLVSGRLVNLLDGAATRVEVAPGDTFLMASGRAHGHECLSAEPCLVYTHGDALWDIALVEEKAEAKAETTAEATAEAKD